MVITNVNAALIPIKDIYDDASMTKEWWMQELERFTLFRTLNMYDEDGILFKTEIYTLPGLPLETGILTAQLYKVNRKVLKRHFRDIGGLKQCINVHNKHKRNIVAGSDIDNMDESIKERL